MSYAIISVGGKQYRVREGQRLLVDRLALDDGAAFSPSVLLVGGDGETTIAPPDVTVTARIVGQERGPKLRIGKYKQRTGYRCHTGFRAALTQIEIESIGAVGARSSPAKAARTRKVAAEPEAATAEASDAAEKPTPRTRAAKPKAEAAGAAEKEQKPATRRRAPSKKTAEGEAD